jgi:hypothetical protein
MFWEYLMPPDSACNMKGINLKLLKYCYYMVKVFLESDEVP